MTRLINRLVSEATAPIGKVSMRLFKMAMLFFLAMSCLIASAIFLTIGFFEFLEPLEGIHGRRVWCWWSLSRRRPHLYARDSTRKAGQSPASLSCIDGSQRVTTIAKS
jgi:hypothetical protein